MKPAPPVIKAFTPVEILSEMRRPRVPQRLRWRRPVGDRGATRAGSVAPRLPPGSGTGGARQTPAARSRERGNESASRLLPRRGATAARHARRRAPGRDGTRGRGLGPPAVSRRAEARGGTVPPAHGGAPSSRPRTAAVL